MYVCIYEYMYDVCMYVFYLFIYLCMCLCQCLCFYLVHNLIPAVVDCEGHWSEWGPCTQGCGKGTRSRLFEVTVVKHGPGGQDCPHANGDRDTHQCDETDCVDVSTDVLQTYCPGATCRAILENSYCFESYGIFCVTHDSAKKSLSAPPGFTASSKGADICPFTCQQSDNNGAGRQRSKSKALRISSSSSSFSSQKENVASDSNNVGSAVREVDDVDSGESEHVNNANSQAIISMSEKQLIAALEAVYPSDKVAAAGNYMGMHDPHVLEISDALASLRAAKIKAAMKWNWDMYAKCAWGRDELLPASCSGQDNWGGFGFTLIDALDTLWMMGLKTEFQAAREWVANEMDLNKLRQKASVFEVNIRIIGGLLAAYDLSMDKIFLDKAKDLAMRFLPIFDTKTGLPYPGITVATKKTSNTWTGQDSLLAELGTLQLEWRYLTYHTGDNIFRTKAENVYAAIKGKDNNGIYPTKINRQSGRASGIYTFGGLSDSFYEYLIKMWVQGGRKEEQWREAYDKAITGMRRKLLSEVQVNDQKVVYIGSSNGRSIDNKMEHLTCFVPGMLALGAALSKESSGKVAASDMQLAKRLAYTCHQMYSFTSSGLAPEVTLFRGGRMSVSNGMYILRPEAAESMFVLHSVTGHPVYRQWAWEMFDAINRNCKAAYGFGSYANVGKTHQSPQNRAESFFMAETLKYLYLIMLPLDDPNRPKLDEYVFNTEAHPLKVFGSDWTPSTARLH